VTNPIPPRIAAARLRPAQPTNCKDICNGQGDGSCCFAKCVCDTDPNKEVRNKYCQEYLDLGCNKIARR
jgi:hypothetical protein